MRNKFYYLLILIVSFGCKLHNVEQKNPVVKKVISSNYSLDLNADLLNRDSIFDKLRKTVTLYNELGKRKKILSYSADESIIKQTHIYYNEHNKFNLWVRLTNNLDTISYTNYYYNDKNLLSKTERIGYNNELISENISKYNERNHLIDHKAYFHKTKGLSSFYHVKYVVDKFGNKLKLSEKASNKKGQGIWYHKHYEYDSLNRRKSKKFKSINTFYFYDDRNNLIKAISKNNIDNKLAESLYQYVYDNHGNWITKISFESETKKWIQIRKIEYY